jgi:parvulin-like peptidyl-prolyl isomerase
MTVPPPKPVLSSLVLVLALALAGCGLSLGPAPTPTPTPTPTATPLPLAVSINGEGITMVEFDAEVARYQQAQTGLGNTASLETATQMVSNDLIDATLLAQGAAAGGFPVEDAMLQARIDALAAQLGGADALAAWETAHGYTDAGFRSALRREMGAAWMRNQIIAAVPSTAEQVHVKQILLYNSDEAQSVLEQLQGGADFDTLAAQYEPVAHGELGWFPRGYLADSAIEQAAFALQPGQHSGVVQTEAGYHILLVVERDPARPLSPDARLSLQESAVRNWLIQRRNESTILFAP